MGFGGVEIGAVLLFVFGEVLLGLAWAVLFVGLRRWRQREAVSPAVRWWVLTGAVLGALVLLAGVAGGVGSLFGLPASLFEVWSSTRFVLPLLAGLLAIAIALVPAAPRPGGASVVLARRTLITFAPRGWLVTLGSVVAVVLALTVAAGMASQRDDKGRWRFYEADVGVVSLGTEIYGWYYSVPALALLVALLATVALALALIARPRLATDIAADKACRRWRARQVVILATAAVVLHLSRILNSLSGTASLEGGASIGDGWVFAYGRFAALEGPLQVAGQLAGVVGWACWFLVPLTALAAASRSRARSEPSATEAVR